MQAVEYQRTRLFWIAVLGLFTAAMLFGLRAGLNSGMRDEIFAGTVNSGELIASAFGMAFFGFGFTLFAASPLLDKIGIGNVLRGSALCFIVSVVMIYVATMVDSDTISHNLFWIGMLVQGIGWGGQEAAINPMTTALYPEDKTHRLNVLHAWWPAGIIVGGLIGFGIGWVDIPWKLAMAAPLAPAIALLLMSKGVAFPQTEREAEGISFSDMMLEIFRAPSCLIWFGAMFLTASLELAPGQWIEAALSAKVGFNAVLILVYVAGLMFVMRHFAGPLAHRLSNPGLLWFSSLFAMVGLYLMATVDSPFMVIVAATIWGTGVCFLWPTMMASVSERYPKGGSWFIGLIGTSAALAMYFVLPMLGRLYDTAMAQAAGGPEKLELLKAEGTAIAASELLEIEKIAAPQAFEFVAMLAIPLLLLFGIVWLLEKRAQRIASQTPETAQQKAL